MCKVQAQRGNIVLVLVVVMVVMAGFYTVVEISLSRLYADRTTINRVTDRHYEIKSMVNMYDLAVRNLVFEKQETIDVTVSKQGDLYADFSVPLFDKYFELRIVDMVSEYMGGLRGGTDIRVSMDNLNVDDFCWVSADATSILCDVTGPYDAKRTQSGNTLITGKLLMTSGGLQEMYDVSVYGLTGNYSGGKFYLDYSNMKIDVTKRYGYVEGDVDL